MSSHNLQELYRHSFRHLDSVHREPNINIKFDFDGYNTWFCTSPIPPTIVPQLSYEPLKESFIIFEAIGRVSTTRHCEGPDINGQSTFWVESRNDLASRALWSQIPQSLGAIAKAAGIAFRLSRIFEVDLETGALRLQVSSTASANVSSTIQQKC